ncbi:5-formyltetrahydrofolate cyclo-ligase [Ursidibacter maritimus]|uniref:5-formyltetrahydrofolate cyclo-ligase n=2 Tax=Ursidibacter maritimus TaxID=1331689 RepID=A0A949WHM6_9PAST|nr:5-formyltetrahydrofolate cyclo-ligase [Ursidibacter maritimus]KAE9542252.1 5-formyltetrahydrofolate cyclo-ligase [Ursidibacter maritimus]MBV6523186.1 5-formyltetrahydrofolate cyclo-ligase [Ursidibacter maritimus]MBV6525372.1 5-formyltetrahydrofolate cyclo-ligase [Ursidibacter maritimus]MBV6527462.1 5-formyltetrahydrofolate cyclo-ligase [Ursidibacter maritimus]MBV6529251.1 5-formyltetrahydrofolate cyclo-ligase [Ursidibacter maritimus]
MNDISPLPLCEQRNQLRKQMRAKRQALTLDEQRFAAQNIIPKSLELIEHYAAQHLAFYLPFNGEISPLPLIEKLRSIGKKIYLPVLHPFSSHQLLFLRFDDKSDLSSNRFGILEPKLDVRKVLPISELEMIFVPLVACDTQGNRLGMGGGFYDRTLSQAKHLISVGLAHQCQQLECLPLESWDEPLDYIVIGNSI